MSTNMFTKKLLKRSLTNLCCIIPAEPGVYCIAISKIIISFIFIYLILHDNAALALFIKTAAPKLFASCPDDKCEKNTKDRNGFNIALSDNATLDFDDISGIALCICVFTVIVNVFLIIGVANDYLKLYWPWFFFTAIEIVFPFLCCLYAIWRLILLAFIFFIIIFVMHMYFWLFVYSFYKSEELLYEQQQMSISQGQQRAQ